LAKQFRVKVNTKFADWDACQLLITSFAVYVGSQMLYVYFSPATGESFIDFYRRKAFRCMLRLPYIGDQAQKQIAEVKSSIEHGLMHVYKKDDFLNQLPDTPMSPKDVIDLLHKYEQLGNVQWQKGRVSGAVYHSLINQDDPHLRLMRDVFEATAYTNPLHAEVFPGIRKMESEIVAICLRLFRGSSEAVGTVTSGGTESLLLACKAYRDYARFERGTRRPTILLPVSAHAGFDKAAQLLDMRIVHVPLDPATMQVDLKAMRARITSDVCLLVASAPGYPHGVFDPVRQVAALGREFNIPVHVDSCLGGFLLPFAHEAGFEEVPDIHFGIEGVTSISADTHKYGFAPKGTSVLLFSAVHYRHYQYFVVGKWPGGIYATSTVAGSRAGSAIATCWASLVSVGRSGYVQATREILTAAQRIRVGFANTTGLFVYGQPSLSVIAVGSHKFNIFLLSDRLSARGWSLNPIQRPAGFHICVTRMHVRPEVIDQLLNDVRELSEQLMNEPNTKPSADSQAAVYGLAQSVPDGSLLNEFAHHYLDIYYRTRL
jgi:sphinganine-1-phosphate aldolase